MNLKKIWLLGAFLCSAVVFTGCWKAPNLSFEETLKVYSEQNKAIKEIISFMNDENHQLQSNAKMKITFEKDKVMKGNSEREWESFSDKKTQNAEMEASVNVNLESENQSTGGIWKLATNLKLNTLLKDYQVFFKLSDFNIDADQKESVGMILAMADAFKGKWFSLNTPELKEVLQNSAKNSLNFWQNDKLYEANVAYYTGVVSTKYDWDPAWKVDFNTEEIQNLMLEMYDLSLSWELSATSGSQEILAQQQQMRDEFQQLLSGMKFENTEAYFVIRSAKKVDFILKNTDFSLGEMKMKLSQELDNDKIIAKAIIFGVDQNENFTVKLILDRDGKNNFKINLSAEKENNKKIEKLLELSGRIKVALTDQLFSLQPQLKINLDSLKVNVEADYSAKKIENHTFTVPTDIQDIKEVLGTLLGGSLPVSGATQTLTGN